MLKKVFLLSLTIGSLLGTTLGNEHFLSAFEAYKSGSFDEALQAIENDLKQTPKSAASLELKGKILTAQKQYRQAEEIFKIALEADPQFYSVRYSFGDLAFAQRKWTEALHHYIAFYDKTKDLRDALIKMIYCQIAIGQFAEANRLATGLDPSDREHPGYYFAHAAIERSSGQDAKAQNFLQQAQTHYGIPLYQQYLRDYLWIFKHADVAPTKKD
ncbi:MAG: tetratricopeptide repeat protein [Verrucomicrobiota bacterium]